MNLDLRTPEGIRLSFPIASVLRRFMAFFIDTSIVYAILTAVGIGLIFVSPDSWGIALFLLFSFFFRNFYFAVTELRGRGQTPGKKMMQIRVVDLHGRPLTGNAVFLRNITRDIETIFPLVVLFAPEALLPNAPWYFGLFASFWLVGIALMPIVTAHHTRVGDVIAGTVVILEPRLRLETELINTQQTLFFTFSEAHLDIYGIRELQLLEKLLRDRVDHDTHAQVAERIAAKINFDSSWRSDPSRFLQEFYRASRARHESRILLGDRQDFKR